MEELHARARRIRLAVFDVDGVLTDGGLLLGPGGAEFKTFHVHDGLGLIMLKDAGLAVAVISSRSSEVVAERMAALGIEYVYQGRQDKRGTLTALMAQLRVTPEETAYVGDDLVDLGAMDLAGFSVAVADAHELVRRRAHWVTRRGGGKGAAREVCEMLLEARGQLDEALARYLPA